MDGRLTYSFRINIHTLPSVEWKGISSINQKSLKAVLKLIDTSLRMSRRFQFRAHNRPPSPNYSQPPHSLRPHKVFSVSGS